ncbi:uncharacterized protein PRCAT00001026001 [Priceomyces carsonii]|uniref:uncharacterized protein n=1 Tax=Priceomyces carsonii TaxID=28549 RepID=UPI002ED955AA|nr:unnamed protein product [Priceomyces carsonii]
MNAVGTTEASQLQRPENCHSSSRIRAFLRLSRVATDDTIRQHLNEVKSTKDCDSYFQNTIIPQWEARSSLIGFCSDYVDHLRAESSHGNTILPDLINPDDYDLRLDPYAIKNKEDQIGAQFAQSNAIANWVQNEREVESIVREQTAEILNEKCYYKDWLKAFKDNYINYTS